MDTPVNEPGGSDATQRIDPASALADAPTVRIAVPGATTGSEATTPTTGETAGGATAAPAGPGTTAVLVPLLVGGLVAVTLGVYGRLHEPTFFAVNLAGFSSGTAVKAWLTTGAFLLALVQLGSAAVMYGRIPGIGAPRWLEGLHRWAGRVAVLLTAPVAVHCLYALGFQAFDTRVLLHSLFGCFFYGAFVAKMLLLSRPKLPGWSLPVVGGAVFTGLTALWLTSSLWFFTTTGVTF
ncbi:MAG TPA: DUF6529 family protein [Pseudonocardia sp.]|nr:DUF6529 family protein [Pseudonocardia sp.]